MRLLWRAALLATTVDLTTAAALRARSVEAVAPVNRASADKAGDERVERLLSQMTQDEKLRLVFGYFGSGANATYHPPAEARPGSAGYVAGVPRLGIPPQWETDAGIGVASQRDAATFPAHTALPSGLATAATWNPDIGYRGGQMIGREARASGFNVMLAGGVNLARDPRNGRNFEYAGEDPLLAATMVGAQIKGIQSNHVIATIKHYAINDQEYGRNVLSSQIDPKAAHLSDLLAFELAIEYGHPGAVMCAYNRINTVYACENAWLLNDVLKGEWGYRGYVMSDWGGVHSTVVAAKAGLDQESAAQSFDKELYFGAPLSAALQSGAVPQARLDDMVRRILTSMSQNGLLDDAVVMAPVDFGAGQQVTLADAEQALVLLKNDNHILPLNPRAKRIAVIGSHADVGVLSGGGSSQVYPVGGPAVLGLGPKHFPGPLVYHPSSPLKELQKAMPHADIRYASGENVAEAEKLAAQSDVVLVFAHQWAAESVDAPFHLPDKQDDLITAVAGKNAKTIVVLETGGAVAMPWAQKVPAIVAAWYPGTEGGAAIAHVLTGAINPSGHLPISFPVDETQLPRPEMNGDPAHEYTPFDVMYHEGAAVGYKWHDVQHTKPLFAFGHGLSYTQFVSSGLKSRAEHGRLLVEFNIKNTGTRAGMAVPQIYGGPVDGGWEAPKRLIGWRKITLAPGQSTHIALQIEPRLLADYQAGWVIKPGNYRIDLAEAADKMLLSTHVTLPAQRLTNWPKR